MQQAAWHIATWIKQQTCQTNQFTHQRPSMCVMVGNGNNGGDGWLVAHYLLQASFPVVVYEVGNANTPDAIRAKAMAQESQITVTTNTNPLPTADIYVDALFGIGLDREPTGVYAKTIQQLSEHKKHHPNTQIIAIDIPSGLNATTGEAFHGVAISANTTLCFIAYKQGLFLKDAADYVGDIHLLSLIPLSDTPNPLAPSVWALSKPKNPQVDYQLPKRPANSHKGSYGHVLIIGGNAGMGGAGMLAAEAALKMGAGKVTLACHDSYHAAVVTRNPNIMTANLHDSEAIAALITQVDVIAIGMGLGRDAQAQTLTENYLSHAVKQRKAIVIDADALYHLAALPKLQQQLSTLTTNKHPAPWFTPHSGEAARLLDRPTSDIESNRLATITQLSELVTGSWLLKGSGSIVRQNNQNYLCTLGNAGMATAGMGDVLAGMAAGLRAQKHLHKDDKQATLFDAVVLHAHTGDVAAKKSGEYGLQSTGLVDALMF